MNRFISNTDEQIKQMLAALEIDSVEELFAGIPNELRLNEPLNLPAALSEYDLKKLMQNLAGRNISASDAVCFLGAGVYDHFVPSVVGKLASYAALCINGEKRAVECQGILQAVYELQIMLERLTGMSAVNVTMNGMQQCLDNAVRTAADMTGKKKIVVLRSVNPDYRKLLNTFCTSYGIELCEAMCSCGDTSKEELDCVLDDSTACVIAQSPNFFGIIEDMQTISESAHAKNALFIAIVDPISLAVLKTPGEYGADIAFGNGQPLGGTLSFGAHHFAFYGVNDALREHLPKEYVITDGDDSFAVDDDAYYGINIVPYQMLKAWAGAVYMSVMGSDGLINTAKTCYSNAVYTYEKLTATSAFKPLFNKPFFREFAVKATKKNVNDINNRMLDYGMIGGYALKNEYPEFGNSWLVAVTEKRSADEVELFVKEASRSI